MMSKEQENILKNIEVLLAPMYRVAPDACPAGHDNDHIARMLVLAEMIYNPKEVDLFLLKLAIWFHNLDRSQKFSGSEADFINNALKGKISQSDIDSVANAVQNHSHLNTPQDSNLLKYLKDCDMLDIGAIGILRIGGVRGSVLPLYAPGDFSKKTPDTSEKSLKSMVQDIDRCLEWTDLGMIRTKKAKKLGKKRFAFMRKFRKEMERELKELKMIR